MKYDYKEKKKVELKFQKDRRNSQSMNKLIKKPNYAQINEMNKIKENIILEPFVDENKCNSQAKTQKSLKISKKDSDNLKREKEENKKKQSVFLNRKESETIIVEEYLNTEQDKDDFTIIEKEEMINFKSLNQLGLLTISNKKPHEVAEKLAQKILEMIRYFSLDKHKKQISMHMLKDLFMNYDQVKEIDYLANELAVSYHIFKQLFYRLLN